jgi:carboxyl-terminal processing protease
MIRKVLLVGSGVVIGAAAVVGVTQPQIFSGGIANAAGTADTYRELSLFGEVFERVRADYVEVPDEQKMIESAINGMLTSLDPHSSYQNAKETEDMQVTTSGKFGGLGIELTMQDGIVKVITPMDGTPAAKAGVLANDLIVAVDGDSLQGLSLDDAVAKMRGDIGTPITLTIQRPNVDKPLQIKMVRAEITVEAVRARAEGDVGYLRISSFTEQAYSGVEKQIKKLKAEIGPDKIKGYILDLRNNPGGLLNQAVDVSDAFLNEGEIVTTRGRHAEQAERRSATPGDLTDGKPLIVLINGGSASASEIVAGALQDQRRATILGTRSFGKGSVQTIISLGEEGSLRLTTARYYTPSGRSIQARGIEPDIVVNEVLPPDIAELIVGKPKGEAGLRGHLQGENEKDGQTSGSLAYVPPDPKDDQQLQEAIGLLDGLQANAAFPPDPNRVIPN